MMLIWAVWVFNGVCPLCKSRRVKGRCWAAYTALALCNVINDTRCTHRELCYSYIYVA